VLFFCASVQITVKHRRYFPSIVDEKHENQVANTWVIFRPRWSISATFNSADSLQSATLLISVISKEVAVHAQSNLEFSVLDSQQHFNENITLLHFVRSYRHCNHRVILKAVRMLSGCRHESVAVLTIMPSGSQQEPHDVVRTEGPWWCREGPWWCPEGPWWCRQSTVTKKSPCILPSWCQCLKMLYSANICSLQMLRLIRSDYLWRKKQGRRSIVTYNLPHPSLMFHSMV